MRMAWKRDCGNVTQKWRKGFKYWYLTVSDSWDEVTLAAKFDEGIARFVPLKNKLE